MAGEIIGSPLLLFLYNCDIPVIFPSKHAFHANRLLMFSTLIGHGRKLLFCNGRCTAEIPNKSSSRD